jgi:hypothetical protein
MKRTMRFLSIEADRDGVRCGHSVFGTGTLAVCSCFEAVGDEGEERQCSFREVL